MAPYSLLAVFAHPDDETFSAGGTLAAYAAAGVRVTLICTTRGEAGKIRAPGLATSATLGQVRERELRCAARELGIADVRVLDFHDSGMAGTPTNADPRAFVNAPSAAVVAQLVGVLRAVRPQVVITFDPHGGYGHPDHIAAQRHTLAAFFAAGEASALLDTGPAWSPARLFYSVPPWLEDGVHVLLDVGWVAEAKAAAMRCHVTQVGLDYARSRSPDRHLHEALRWEAFSLAVPAPPPSLRLPDLFAGL